MLDLKKHYIRRVSANNLYLKKTLITRKKPNIGNVQKSFSILIMSTFRNLKCIQTLNKNKKVEKKKFDLFVIPGFEKYREEEENSVRQQRNQRTHRKRANAKRTLY